MTKQYVLLKDAIDALRGRVNANTSPAQRQMLKTAAAEITRCATADVVPEIHGSWRNSGVPGSMLYSCSRCGFDTGAYSFRYCPHCGARMDAPSNLAELEDAERSRRIESLLKKGVTGW